MVQSLIKLVHSSPCLVNGDIFNHDAFAGNIVGGSIVTGDEDGQGSGEKED